jgi:hypothetical protein
MCPKSRLLGHLAKGGLHRIREAGVILSSDDASFRLPGWTEADEIEKPGTYDARHERLSTVRHKVFS